jgi:hypothetical protein
MNGESTKDLSIWINQEIYKDKKITPSQVPEKQLKHDETRP